jgi:hypothetical protein
MGAPKGHKKYGGGRKPGQQNKTTIEVKAAILKAYTTIGGDKTFGDWAKENQTEFYKLFARLIPVEVKNADDKAFRVELVEEIVTRTADPDANAPTSNSALPQAT